MTPSVEVDYIERVPKEGLVDGFDVHEAKFYAFGFCVEDF
jgi:hypothetical protein